MSEILISVEEYHALMAELNQICEKMNEAERAFDRLLQRHDVDVSRHGHPRLSALFRAEINQMRDQWLPFLRSALRERIDLSGTMTIPQEDLIALLAAANPDSA